MARSRIPPKALREIWGQVPAIKCKGKCSNSCGPIPARALAGKLAKRRTPPLVHHKGKVRL